MPPALPATTSARAKASFRKNGPRLTEREIKRIERDAVLSRRAEELKERDANRKRAREKARMKEVREREARRKTGLGLATQLVGFSHSQRRMKVGTFSYRRVGKLTPVCESGVLIFDVMKGAMEGFLGIAKRKESEEKGKENQVVEKEDFGIGAANMEDILEEDMFDDDICLGELDTPACEQGNSGGVRLGYLDNKDTKEETDAAKMDVVISTSLRPSYRSAISSKGSPPRQVTKLPGSEIVSPPDMWGDLFASGTQICRELSQPQTPSKQFINPAEAEQTRIEPSEPTSDDLFDSSKKTSNPPINISDGVVALDFAYFKKISSQNIVLGDRVVPKSPSSRSFGSSKRKRGQIFPNNVIAASSPKVTSNCASFTAAQCSFTSDWGKYGLSSQIIAQAVEEESDTDEEDFSFRDPPAPKPPVETSMNKDRVLMPPPPLRKPPNIFKPPANHFVPKVEEGLGIGIWGISTQDMRAVFDHEGSDTEEDEAGPSLPSPPLRSEAKQLSTNSHSPHTRPALHPSRLQASSFIRPALKKARLASAQAPPQLQRSRPSLTVEAGPKANSLTRSFSNPPFQTLTAPMDDLRMFGISTQVLNDAVGEDVELSPLDTKEKQGFGKLNACNTNQAPGAGLVGRQPADSGASIPSSSFGKDDDMDAVFWDEAGDGPGLHFYRKDGQ
jgi:hypothetical protein